MSNRAKCFLGLWLYLTLCSVFMGVVFSRNYSVLSLSIGFGCLLLAQVVAIGLLALIERTEP